MYAAELVFLLLLIISVTSMKKLKWLLPTVVTFSFVTQRLSLCTVYGVYFRIYKSICGQLRFYFFITSNKKQHNNPIKGIASRIIGCGFVRLCKLENFSSLRISIMYKAKSTGWLNREAGSTELGRDQQDPRFPLLSLTGDLFIFLPAERRAINGG